MKRALLLMFAALSLLIPALAQADWVTDEIKWRISSVGTPTNPTGIYVRDTLYRNLEFETVGDTTGVFSLNHASILPRGVVAPGISEVQAPVSTGALTSFANDTTVVAWIVIQSDSSAAPTATLSSLTVAIDGRVGGFGPATTLARGWVKADSALVNGAAGGTLIVGNESVAIPIRSISPYGNISRWANLRMRTTAGTGILSACRVFIRYWQDPAATTPHR